MRKPRLKLISAILAMLLVIGMVGCTSQENGSTTVNNNSTQTANDVSNAVAPPASSDAGADNLPESYTEADLLTRAEDSAMDYSYDEYEGKILIKDYEGSSEIVVIPSQIDGKEVAYIGAKAFLGNSKLKAVIIPDTVISLWKSAFETCSKLETVIIKGESLTEIREGAFMGCSELTSINLPNSITNIGMGVFSSCFALRAIDIPLNIRIIDSTTFCYAGIETATIPEGVTEISSAAFSTCPNLTSVTIPASVTTIVRSAFEFSENVTIIAPTGSYAETFAKENEIPFEAAN